MCLKKFVPFLTYKTNASGAAGQVCFPFIAGGGG